MTRILCALAIASTCVVACSKPAPSDTAATSGPAQTADRADQQAPAATPSAAPAATTPDTAAPPAASAPASSPAARRPAAASPAASAPAAQTPATSTPPNAAPAVPETPEAPAASPAPPAEPVRREVTIPSGTSLRVKLLTTMASNTSHIEDPVKGSLARPLVISGTTVLPAGTELSGSVLEVNESGRVKGRASITFRFDRLVADGETFTIRTARVTREAAADRKSDVKKGGIGAGVGAVVGGVIGGGKGAAIGAVAGGAGTVLATKGQEVELPAGTAVSVLLQDPITVTVTGS